MKQVYSALFYPQFHFTKASYKADLSFDTDVNIMNNDGSMSMALQHQAEYFGRMSKYHKN